MKYGVIINNVLININQLLTLFNNLLIFIKGIINNFQTYLTMLIWIR